MSKPSAFQRVEGEEIMAMGNSSCQGCGHATLARIAFKVLAAGAIWIRWDATQHRGLDGRPRYFWQEGRPAPAAEAAPVQPASAPVVEPKK